MPAFHKTNSRCHFQFTNSQHATAHGGQVLVDALCRRFGLWQKIAQTPFLDPRTRTGSGFAPESLIAQLLFSLTSGGITLADAQRLGQDPVLLELIGLQKGADESTLGQWLRAQTKESVRALHRLNADFVRDVLAEVKPGRVRHAGQLEVFFDDTEIEVYGKKIAGARLNYEGNRALSWQTLWLGPFLLDGILDGAGDVSQHLPVLLQEHRAFWENQASYLYADSASSSAEYLGAIAGAGFTRWSVSYNKWTQVLDRLAGELPAEQWSAEQTETWTDGTGHRRQYAWIKHLPGENDQARTFATVRRKQEGELFWRYYYVACEAGDIQDPPAVFERHALKGAKEQGFSQVLSDLDLHHPPCLELIANQAFYAIAMLAFNVLMALKVLDLPDDAQGWRVRSIIRHLLTVPVTVSYHARYRTATVCVATGWLRWWRLFMDQWVPKRKPGRPAKEPGAGGSEPSAG